MILFSIILVVLLGVSLLTFAETRQKPTLVRSAFADPPADWPDVPAHLLGVFAREGRINTVMPKPKPVSPRRLHSFKAAQAYVLECADLTRVPLPKIALNLSQDGGPEWTDIRLDDAVIAQVPTKALQDMHAA